MEAFRASDLARTIPEAYYASGSSPIRAGGGTQITQVPICPST